MFMYTFCKTLIGLSLSRDTYKPLDARGLSGFFTYVSRGGENLASGSPLFKAGW